MPITITQVHSTESRAAVNKIKSAIRKDGLNLSFDVPKEFLAKRQYMQSDEFIKDEHNSKMLNLGQKLGEQREKIAKKIAERNKTAQLKLEQGIDGFAKIENWPERNELLPYFTQEETGYQATKIRIKNICGIVKNQLGIK